MELKEMIFALCSAQGVSGSEEPAAAIARELLSPYAEVRTDSDGNLYATFGNPNADKTLLLDAHLDRIGLIVTDINENGFVKVDKCGGMDIRTLQNAVFTTEDGYRGVVCCLPPHLTDGKEDKATPMNKTWLDFGMTYDEVAEHIQIGDKLTFCNQPAELLGGKITAPALDNRCGVASLIRVAQLLSGKDLPYRVVILLSAQEETYGTGSMTGSFRLDADEAIVVDVSFASQPDVSGQYGGISLKGGAMIGISPILCKPMTEQLKALAGESGRAFQLEAMTGRTGTNADHISVTKGGVKTAMISIPQRYMHTQGEVVAVEDVENTAQLIADYILSGGVHHG